MPGMKTLSKQLQALEEQLVSCMKCGMCQSVCPLFEQTHKEADVARGKLVLLESLMKDMFENPHGVNKRLNKCLLCGSCAANCPSGVNATQIFIQARTILTGYLKLPFIKKMIFRKMLANPKVFDRITALGSKLQKLVLTEKNPDTKTSSLRLLSPLLNDRQIIPVAEQSLQTQFKKMTQNLHPSGPAIALFTGCLIDKIFPGIGVDAIRVLHHHNCRVFIPENPGCCGIPALAAGDRPTFLSLVNHNLNLFQPHKYDYIVTACATCTSTLKKLWPSMVKDEPSALKNTVARLAEKTMDISQFLCRVTGLKPQQQSEKQKIVTYHDPCHLAKSLGIRKEPRDILNAASGYTLKEMKDPDRCCGMGGSFNLYHYDISSKIGTVKRKSIEETHCNTVSTSCPACMLQLSDMLSKAERPIDIKHPIQIYAERLD